MILVKLAIIVLRVIDCGFQFYETKSIIYIYTLTIITPLLYIINQSSSTVYVGITLKSDMCHQKKSICLVGIQRPRLGYYQPIYLNHKNRWLDILKTCQFFLV